MTLIPNQACTANNMLAKHVHNETMRFRFHIRDLLTVTLLVALALGWHMDHLRMTRRLEQLYREAEFSTHRALEARNTLRSTINGLCQRNGEPSMTVEGVVRHLKDYDQFVIQTDPLTISDKPTIFRQAGELIETLATNTDEEFRNAHRPDFFGDVHSIEFTGRVDSP